MFVIFCIKNLELIFVRHITWDNKFQIMQATVFAKLCLLSKYTLTSIVNQCMRRLLDGN